MDTRNRYYNIFTGKKIAVIFNHTKFLFNRISNLENNDIDINRLKRCFKHIGFNVQTHENITADEIGHEMDKSNKVLLNFLNNILYICYNIIPAIE